MTDLPHEFAALIELKQPGVSVIEGPLGAERRDRLAGAHVDEQLTARIGGHACHFAVRRQRNDVGVRLIVEFRNRLRNQRGAGSE